LPSLHYLQIPAAYAQALRIPSRRLHNSSARLIGAEAVSQIVEVYTIFEHMICLVPRDVL